MPGSRQNETTARQRSNSDAYLQHLYSRAVYYDGLSKAVLGRSILHVTLLHHKLINALFLADAVQMFRDKGWHVIARSPAFVVRASSIGPECLRRWETIFLAPGK